MAKKLKLSDDEQFWGKIIGLLVRNAMEDYHVKHLTDEQMAELNPIIRNGIATGLHLMHNCGKHQQNLEWFALNIPKYWEDCEIVPDVLLPDPKGYKLGDLRKKIFGDR